MLNKLKISCLENKLNLFFLFFTISFCWISILYGSTLFFSFGKDDDYYFFAYDTKNFTHHPQYLQYFQLGRYSSGIIWFFVSKLITHLDDFMWIRLITIVFSSLAMTLLTISYYKTKTKIFNAIILSALIFPLPWS